MTVTALNSHYRTLSDLLSLGPAQANPHLKRAAAQVRAFCTRHGIALPQQREYTTQAAYWFPSADEQRLVTIGLLMDMLLTIDGALHQDPLAQEDHAARQHFAHCMVALHTGQANDDHPLYAVCAELHERLMVDAPQDWLARFMQHLAQYLEVTTYSLDAVLDETGAIDFERYVELRPHEAGMYPTIDLIEFATGCYLPPEAVALPEYQTMRICTGQVGSLMNDIFSYHKEVIIEGTRFNLVNVYMEDNDGDFDEAVHQAVTFVNDAIRTVEACRQTLPEWCPPPYRAAMEQVADGMRAQLIASYHWQMATNRYRSPDSPFPELRTLLSAS